MTKRKHVSRSQCRQAPAALMAALLTCVKSVGGAPDEILKAAGASFRLKDLMDGKQTDIQVETFSRVNRACNKLLREHIERSGQGQTLNEDQFRLMCQCIVGAASLGDAIQTTSSFFSMFDGRIDEHRVGLLGICAGGGYAVSAALTDHRFKALGTVVASNIGRAFRSFQSKKDILQTLDEVGRQRTAVARGGHPRRDPWIPDSLEQARTAGVTDPGVLEAVEFYRESSYRHPRSTNRVLFQSFGYLLGFDAFHLVPELLTQPLQVIVGGRRGNTGQFEDGQTLFDSSPSVQKDFFVVEHAGHYDMYYKPEYVDQAVERLSVFFHEHLDSRTRA